MSLDLKKYNLKSIQMKAKELSKSDIFDCISYLRLIKKEYLQESPLDRVTLEMPLNASFKSQLETEIEFYNDISNQNVSQDGTTEHDDDLEPHMKQLIEKYRDHIKELKENHDVHRICDIPNVKDRTQALALMCVISDLLEL